MDQCQLLTMARLIQHHLISSNQDLGSLKLSLSMLTKWKAMCSRPSCTKCTTSRSRPLHLSRVVDRMQQHRFQIQQRVMGSCSKLGLVTVRIVRELCLHEQHTVHRRLGFYHLQINIHEYGSNWHLRRHRQLHHRRQPRTSLHRPVGTVSVRV